MPTIRSVRDIAPGDHGAWCAWLDSIGSGFWLDKSHVQCLREGGPDCRNSEARRLVRVVRAAVQKRQSAVK